MKDNNLPPIPPIDVLAIVKAAIKETRWYEWILLAILIISALIFWFRAINQRDRILMEQFRNQSASMYVGALFFQQLKKDLTTEVVGLGLKGSQQIQRAWH